jgi:hypothetical protein
MLDMVIRTEATIIMIMITEAINKTVFGLSDWFRGFDWIGALFFD